MICGIEERQTLRGLRSAGISALASVTNMTEAEKMQISRHKSLSSHVHYQRVKSATRDQRYMAFGAGSSLDAKETKKNEKEQMKEDVKQIISEVFAKQHSFVTPSPGNTYLPHATNPYFQYPPTPYHPQPFPSPFYPPSYPPQPPYYPPMPTSSLAQNHFHHPQHFVAPHQTNPPNQQMLLEEISKKLFEKNTEGDKNEKE